MYDGWVCRLEREGTKKVMDDPPLPVVLMDFAVHACGLAAPENISEDAERLNDYMPRSELAHIDRAWRRLSASTPWEKFNLTDALETYTVFAWLHHAYTCRDSTPEDSHDGFTADLETESALERWQWRIAIESPNRHTHRAKRELARRMWDATRKPNKPRTKRKVVRTG